MQYQICTALNVLYCSSFSSFFSLGSLVAGRWLCNIYILIWKAYWGYAVQELHNYLINNNLSNHLIDIGGEVIVNGLNNGDPWTVGIQDPNYINNKPIILIKNINTNFLAIATSGEYRNYNFDIDGNKVTHTINPKTLKSINNNILSVTVVHESSATYADAYATSFNAMGSEMAIEIANKNGIAVMLIIERNNEIEFIYSNKWYDLSLWMNC